MTHVRQAELGTGLKGFLGRRSVRVLLLAAMPVALVTLRLLFDRPDDAANVAEVAFDFAGMYQGFRHRR